MQGVFFIRVNKDSQDSYTKVEILIGQGMEELLPEEFYSYAPGGLWIEDRKDKTAIICYPEDMDAFLGFIDKAGIKVFKIQTISEKKLDYGALTKRYFRPIKIEGITIIPPWIKKRPQKSIVIEPGMAFGTGRHESTRLMMRLMGKIDIKDRHVIDIGCGSGILAIYASMLGAKSVVAVDNDFDAVLSAKRNMGLNRLEDIITLCADLNDIKGTFDIVLANLDIRTFEKNMKKIAEFIGKDSYLVISGVLRKERKLAMELFKDLVPIIEDYKNSWMGMVLTQKTSNPL